MSHWIWRYRKAWAWCSLEEPTQAFLFAKSVGVACETPVAHPAYGSQSQKQQQKLKELKYKSRVWGYFLFLFYSLKKEKCEMCNSRKQHSEKKLLQTQCLSPYIYDLWHQWQLKWRQLLNCNLFSQVVATCFVTSGNFHCLNKMFLPFCCLKLSQPSAGRALHPCFPIHTSMESVLSLYISWALPIARWE